METDRKPSILDGFTLLAVWRDAKARRRMTLTDINGEQVKISKGYLVEYAMEEDDTVELRRKEHVFHMSQAEFEAAFENRP